jgi:hypothetical protein
MMENRVELMVILTACHDLNTKVIMLLRLAWWDVKVRFWSEVLIELSGAEFRHVDVNN